jgi:ferric-dicitrate binding protein FerR (iron transport regulator)
VTAAAAILVTAGSLVGIWRLKRSTVSGHAPAEAFAKDLREHVTARGERSTFQLPDGTPVILAAASRLRYPASFGPSDGPRHVYLEGKALFAVQHDARRPFVVHTAHGVTEDLGTRFSVQAYATDTAVEVVVAEGSVALRQRASVEAGTFVRPGQIGRLTRGGEAVVSTPGDLDRYLAWTQGRLVFEDTPLRDAVAELSRWYDLDFVLADSTLGARHLTAVLAGEAIPETLTLLGSTLDIAYERHDRTVTFFPRRHH